MTAILRKYHSLKYRITSNDSEAVRKQKAYSWIIDYQIARVMPNARPAPDSATNYVTGKNTSTIFPTR